MSLLRSSVAERRRLRGASQTARAVCYRTVAAFILVLGIATTALAQRYVPGEILVGYRPDATAERKAATEAAYGLVLLKDFPHIGARHYRLPPGLGVESAIAALQQLPIVAYAEPNYLRRIHATPNDPQFSEQWYLFNRGQVVNGTAGVPGDDITWLPAMDIFSGTKEVIVAVVDSGVALDHSDLASRASNDPRDPVNGTDDDGNTLVDDNMGWDFVGEDRRALDEAGHGTLVASLIAAERDNGRYGAGGIAHGQDPRAPDPPGLRPGVCVGESHLRVHLCGAPRSPRHQCQLRQWRIQRDRA